jgi:hypothetical protein
MARSAKKRAAAMRQAPNDVLRIARRLVAYVTKRGGEAPIGDVRKHAIASKERILFDESLQFAKSNIWIKERVEGKHTYLSTLGVE